MPENISFTVHLELSELRISFEDECLTLDSQDLGQPPNQCFSARVGQRSVEENIPGVRSSSYLNFVSIHNHTIVGIVVFNVQQHTSSSCFDLLFR